MNAPPDETSGGRHPGAPPVIEAARFDAAVFDLDGVITRTARLHAEAWRQLFDDFLQRRAAAAGEPFRPFDAERDYQLYVDGRPRADGVRTFLASRGIALPEGGADDPIGADTVHGLGARKNELFLQLLNRSGTEVFSGSVAFIRRLREAGLKTAIVSSSRNAAAVLTAAGLTDLFDVRVDGVEAARLGLKGKPAPDTFLCAARMLHVAPARTLGVEDALAGIEAIRAAGYGLAIGVDRSNLAEELRRCGADLVARDLSSVAIVPPTGPDWGPGLELPAVPTADPEWLVIEDGFTLTREHELESLFAVANGHLGTRGSLAEGSALSAPATFVAGLFDTTSGATPTLVALPDWTRLSLTVDGHALRLDTGRILEHRRILDLRQGALWREWRHQDPSGRVTRVRGLRLASLADRRLLAQSALFTPENYSGAVTVDASVAGPLVRRTSGGVTAAMASAGELIVEGGARTVSPFEPPIRLEVELGRSYRLDRVVAVCSSIDSAQPEAEGRTRAAQALQAGLPKLVERHLAAWQERWAASDIRVEGDPTAQRALRFAAYHLLSAANPDDDRVSIAARALTGGAYSGHVFWDTEIFMLPFFTLTWPEAAGALLRYRHRTLPAARAKAARRGARGAFYAWESADTGEDVTPAFVLAPGGRVTPIFLADQEQHISADIAYGVWSYWRATGDEGFLLDAGAEILLETARFWASRAEPGDDGLRHIRRVVGPDEFHEAVDDDAYTNGMAQWNLETAAAAAKLLAERWPMRWRELSGSLGLAPDEITHWVTVARELYTGFDPHTGLIEQFQGYFALQDLDLASFEPRNAPFEMLLGRERLQASQIIKQPDVVMLLHLLWDRYPPDVRHANFRYYEPRCAHGSSLSPAIHALVAARLGDLPLAQRYFRQAYEIDLADRMGNAAGGVHAAALGGLWQAAVFGFAGLRITEQGPEVHPNLPPTWRDLAFRIRLRGQDHDLCVRSGPPPEASPREMTQ